MFTHWFICWLKIYFWVFTVLGPMLQICLKYLFLFLSTAVQVFSLLNPWDVDMYIKKHCFKGKWLKGQAWNQVTRLGAHILLAKWLCEHHLTSLYFSVAIWGMEVIPVTHQRVFVRTKCYEKIKSIENTDQHRVILTHFILLHTKEIEIKCICRRNRNKTSE